MAKKCCPKESGSDSRVLSVTKLPLYEYATIWAEESSATNAGSAEWSFGNGSTGFIGLAWDNSPDWEVVAMSFNADTYATNGFISVDLMNYGNVASNAAANTLATITVVNAADGGGTANNVKKWLNITPVAIPANAVLGFITRIETGNISDARVTARLRRQIGEYVSDVTLA